MAGKYWFAAIAVAGCCALYFAKASCAQTVDIQDQAAIRSAIEAAVAPRLTAIHATSPDIEVGAIDPRLRLAACANIEVNLPPTNAAMITAKVTCREPSWTLYVPVRLHAWVDAVVASTNLAPNTKLTAVQLTRGKADAFANAAGLMTDPREVEGKILRVGLTAGAPILSPQLDLPIAVRRGQKIVLTLSDPVMTIKTTAVALEDGRVGDNISVQNPDSQKTLQATVARDGGVEIRF